MAELKQEMLALLLAMYDRIQSLEIVQEQQNSAIQVRSPAPDHYVSGTRKNAVSSVVTNLCKLEETLSGVCRI